MAILDTDDYPAIRRAIDIDLDASRLTDEQIASDGFAPAAVDEVLLRDPLAATRVGREGRLIKRAAILYCAALLVPTIPVLATEQFGLDFKMTRQARDPYAQVADLRSRAADALQLVLTPTNQAPTRPAMFRAAHACRRGR